MRRGVTCFCSSLKYPSLFRRTEAAIRLHMRRAVLYNDSCNRRAATARIRSCVGRKTAEARNGRPPQQRMDRLLQGRNQYDGTGTASGNDGSKPEHRIFRGRGGFHRKRDSGFPQCGRPVPPALQISAGGHAEPRLFCEPSGGIFRFLPEEDALP